MKALPASLLPRLESGGRILVSRLRHLGDVVLTLPLLDALRERFPRSEVHYMAETSPLQAVQAHPAVHRLWESPRTSTGVFRMAPSLRRVGFDLGIDLFANPRSALLLFASGARVRLGEDRRLRRHLYTHARHLIPGRTAMLQHLAVLEDLGMPLPVPRRPVLHLTDDESQRGRELRQRFLETPSAVLLHVDASHPSKEWPTEHWLQLARHLRQQGVGVLVSRAPGPAVAHHALVEAAADDDGLVFLPVMPLRTLLGVVATCDGVVSVDGGVMHCAVALGVPTVALFGPTDARIWFPYTQLGPYRVCDLGAREEAPQEHLRQPGCLQALSVEQVVTTLAALGSEGAGGAST